MTSIEDYRKIWNSDECEFTITTLGDRQFFKLVATNDVGTSTHYYGCKLLYPNDFSKVRLCFEQSTMTINSVLVENF